MYFLSGEIPQPLGNGHFVHVPYNTFRAHDRWIIVAVVTDGGWLGLVEAFDADDLRNSDFATQPGRWKNRQYINQRVAATLATQPSSYWLELLAKHKVPCAPVNDFEHALNDVQIRARNMVVEVKHPRGDVVQMPGNPVKLSDTASETFESPPILGQHTDMVLGGLLGKSEAELIALRNERVVF